MNTLEKENKYMIPFFNRNPISVSHGKGVYFWDEEGKKYIDFTSGWGVTSIGHANPVITRALTEQGGKFIQSPNAGLLLSPVRAQLLELMSTILPEGVSRIFFSNSGAEANDAAMKIARKVSGKKNIVSTLNSFHGRTIGTMTATGQPKYLERFSPLMPHHQYVPFNDLPALKKALEDDVAAFIVEPIQGEGGVNIPAADYLEKVSALCQQKGVFLIIDEIQTGFCRTGPFFHVNNKNIKVDFLTMAKGIAGGFPIGAFAVTGEIAAKVAKGDHGGTYCGNPLGCAVAYAVINYMLEHNIPQHVQAMGEFCLQQLSSWQERYPAVISNVRGAGLLIAMQVKTDEQANAIEKYCIGQGLLINKTQGNIIRIFPALNITQEEFTEGLAIIEKAIETL